MTKLRSHTVRYALERLIERGIATPYSFIDCELLGYTAYSTLCSLSSHQLSVRQRFERALLDHENVAALYRIGGDFHYKVTMLARTTHDLLVIIDDLFGRFGEIIFERCFAIRAEGWLFSRKYLMPKAKPSTPLHIAPSSTTRTIDDLDAKLLHRLSLDGSKSFAELAGELAIPASTVEYRIRRLEKEEIVKGWVYSIASHLFGMNEYKLLVSMKRSDPQTQEVFFAFCAKQSHIYNLMRCIGSWDYEVGVEVDSYEKVTQIVQAMYESFSSLVHTVKVVPVFDGLKGSMFPFRKAE